jgi:hypothetical protein
MNILCICLPLIVMHYNENQFGKCIISKPTKTVDKIVKVLSYNLVSKMPQTRLRLGTSFIHPLLGFYTCEEPTEVVRRCTDAAVQWGHVWRRAGAADVDSCRSQVNIYVCIVTLPLECLNSA